MIVTGCMRSGTKSVAEIFGINHEVFFEPNNLAGQEIGWKKDFYFPSEASWMAQPCIDRAYLQEPNPKKIKHKIIHLVRHPLAVIRSLIGIEFFDRTSVHAKGHEPYYNFLTKHLQYIEEADALNAAIFYYIKWNEPLMAYPRIRIEDIANCPRLNSRNRASVSWNDLQKSPGYGALKTMAENFYYECPSSKY